MELRPFDLEAAQRGEPLVTRNGHKAKFIVCVPEAAEGEKIVALIGDELFMFYENGLIHDADRESPIDLLMAPPPMRSINGYEFPEPAREPLKEGQEYCLVDLTLPAGASHKWDGEACEFRWLERGLIQLTREGAEAQLKAMVASIGGQL